MIRRQNSSENAVHLLIDVLGIAEPVAILGDADCARTASPIINVLKKMVVQGFVMGKVQRTLGPGFVRAREKHREFVFVEFVLVLNIELVPTDRRAGVAKRILLCGIGHGYRDFPPANCAFINALRSSPPSPRWSA
jgi:hypothetical protein